MNDVILPVWVVSDFDQEGIKEIAFDHHIIVNCKMWTGVYSLFNKLLVTIIIIFIDKHCIANTAPWTVWSLSVCSLIQLFLSSRSSWILKNLM